MTALSVWNSLLQAMVEELETVGRLTMARIKLAFEHMTTRNVTNYENQDIMACHQGINQAITLFKWM